MEKSFGKHFAVAENNFLVADILYWEPLLDWQGNSIGKGTDERCTIEDFVFLVVFCCRGFLVFFSQYRVDHLNNSVENILVPSFSELQLGCHARLGYQATGKDWADARNLERVVDSETGNLASFVKR